MFKVLENGDGSTSIFCSKTGKLICKIRSQQKNMGLGCRPVNVVEPSPKPRSYCFNLDLKAECLSDEDDKKQNSKKKNCDSPTWNEPKEDFSDDCIAPDEFARCLNLVSTEKFKNESIDQLKSTFPLRHLSRTKAFVVSDDLHDVKLPDDMPITSSLGLKILNLNKEKNYYCDQTIEMKIKNYDSFCRFQINSSYVLGHFPKLRCREKKEYPLCIPSKILRFAPAHTYAFNKRQRLEKLITFKTGLSTHSRRLLQKCNNRLAVSIKRLPDDEIEYWMQKRARFGPITADLIKGEEPSSVGSDSDATVIEQTCPTYIDIDLCSDESSESSDSDDPSFKYKIREEINLQGVLSNSRDSVSPLRSRNGQYPKQLSNLEMYKDCCVILSDVLFYNIQKCGNDYYVAGTNIQIPFLQDYIDSLNPKTRSNLVIPVTNLVTNSRYDHAYHRPFSQDACKKKLLSNSQCLNHKSSKTKNDFRNKLKVRNGVRNKSSLPVKFNNMKNSNTLKPAVNKTVSELEVIPIIDLTDSASNSPTKEVAESSFLVFRCYGCGYKKTSPKESDAYCVATKHMKSFHCVSDPKSFLNVCKTSSGVTLEAFPGYKSSFN